MTATTPPAFRIRTATLADTSQIASLAATSYMNSELSKLLSPLRHVFMLDHIRAYHQRALARMRSPANVSLVVTAVDGGPVMGYAQFIRCGAGAPAAHSWAGAARAAYIATRQLVDDYVWRFTDRSTDPAAARKFRALSDSFWVAEEAANTPRWYVQS